VVPAALDSGGAADKLNEAIEENSRLRKALAGMTPQLDDLARRVMELESQPRTARAALRAPPRELDAPNAEHPGGVDVAIKTLSALPERERTLALMKVSLANPKELRL
jgi:hypothetical protein